MRAVDCVGALIRDEQHRVYLQRRTADRRLLPGIWDIVGGHLEAGETPEQALAREVEEETGLVVRSWEGPLYSVTAVAVEMGWQMHCEVHRAVEFEGELRIDDPDGIVVDAAFVTPDLVDRHLADCFRWVRDPLAAWLLDRWEAADARAYHFEITGTSLADFQVVAASDG